jgi:hypothetical protein
MYYALRIRRQRVGPISTFPTRAPARVYIARNCTHAVIVYTQFTVTNNPAKSHAWS